MTIKNRLLKYCNECIYPDTKPDLFFKDGVCSACFAFHERAKVDWDERERAFIQLATDAQRSRSSYDCLIPVSGGKDSHFQVLTALRFGLKPLACCASTDDLSPIGRKNL